MPQKSINGGIGSEKKVYSVAFLPYVRFFGKRRVRIFNTCRKISSQKAFDCFLGA